MTNISVSPPSPPGNPGPLTPASDTRKATGKPYPGFPLFLHQSGRWAKKIRQKLVYFGKASDGWEPALAKYQAERDYWHAGRRPPENPDGLTVSRLADHFYHAKQQRHAAGEITARTLGEYFATCTLLTAAFGGNRMVSDLSAQDFAKLRGQLADRVGPVRLVNEITRVRGVFKFGFDNNLIDRPMRFGSEFKRPSRKVLRLHRVSKGLKLFTPTEIKKLIAAAGVQLRAMILLGINCGLGNGDVSALNLSHLDLPNGVMDFPRPKTGVARRAILWPQTVAALKAAIEARPTPTDPADANAVFITKYGRRWATGSQSTAVGLQFSKLLKAEGIEREGVNFYACRHTFRTVADASGDQRAIDRIMGHESGHISTAYVERIEDARLRKVSDHVRRWLFAKSRKAGAK